MKGDALQYRVIKKWCLQIELSVEIICYKQNQKWESVKCKDGVKLYIIVAAY